MAHSFLLNQPWRFPTDTAVGVYPAASIHPGSSPNATVIATATVAADGTATLGLPSTLNANTAYVAYALVNGEHVYSQFRTDPDDASLEPRTFHPFQYGGVGDGVADDSAALIACHDAAKAWAFGRQHRSVMSLDGGKWKLTTTLNIDTHFVAVHGKGGVIDASQLTGVANAIIFYASTDTVEGQKTWTNSVNRSGEFELIGPGMTAAGVRGIYFDTGSNITYGSARMTLHNVVVHEFSTGIEWGDNAYGIEHENVSVWNCNVAAQQAFDVSNAGERIVWRGGFIFGCKYGVLNSNGACDIMFFGVSFDYPTWDPALTNGTAGSVTSPLSRIAQAFSGRISLFGCHIEANHDTDYWFCTGDRTSRLLLSGCEIFSTGSKNNFEIFYAAQGATFADRAQHAGIILRDCHVKMRSDRTYNLGALVGGPGRVQASGTTWEFGTPEWLPPVARSIGRFDGTFEGSFALADWTLTSSTAGSEPTISATQAYEGTQSLRIKAAVNGDNSRAYATFPVAPGQLVLASFRTYLSGLTAGGNFLKLSVQQLNAAGTPISTTTYGATSGADLWGDTSSAWVLRKIYPLLVQRGAQSVRLLFEGNAWPAAALAYIDDLVVNLV